MDFTVPTYTARGDELLGAAGEESPRLEMVNARGPVSESYVAVA